MEIPATRICKKCNEEKTLDSFTKNKNCKYGREHTCLKCRIICTNTFNKNNPELVKKYKNNWHEKNKLNPEYRKRQLESKRKYRKNNPDAVKYWNDIAHVKYAHKKSQYAKTYREKHKEKLKAYTKERHQFRKNNLTDSFVKYRITHKSILKSADIPQELIEIKREQLKLKRDAEEAKTNNN